MDGTFAKSLGFVCLLLLMSLLYAYSLGMLGTLLLKRFKDAFDMSAKHTAVFNKLSATFSPETVKKWEEMVTAWNANHKAPNPYRELECGMLFPFRLSFILLANIIHSNDSPGRST